MVIERHERTETDMGMRTFKTEIDPWAEAMKGTRPLVKRPAKPRVLVVVRSKDGKMLTRKQAAAHGGVS